MRIGDKIALFLATFGYVGKIPFAPGTFGSAAGIVACFFLWKMGGLFVFSAVAMLIGIAVWSADRMERVLSTKDPQIVVIDEVAGMAVTLLGFPFTAPVALAGFIAFRVLDIFKPFPISWMERRLPGGWGVVMDDVTAGVIANLILRGAWHLLGTA